MYDTRLCIVIVTAALLAMKGMMIQENVTLDDALKMMEDGQMPNSQAPAMPPRVIGKPAQHIVQMTHMYMYMYKHIIYKTLSS